MAITHYFSGCQINRYADVIYLLFKTQGTCKMRDIKNITPIFKIKKIGPFFKVIVNSFFMITVLTACGGGSNDGPDLTPVENNNGKKTVDRSFQRTTLSGKVTFDYVPVLVNAQKASRLDFTKTEKRPARAVVVDIVSPVDQSIVASGVTNAEGNYTIQVPANRVVFVRVKAALADGPQQSTVVEVYDNTLGGQWALDGPTLSTSAETMERNVHANSGWTGTAYVEAQRASGVFAILDTIYTNIQKIRAIDSTAVFSRLTVYWSPKNVSFRGDIRLGQVGNTHYINYLDASGVKQHAIFLLGKAENNTDEFDRHVISHEFAHYLQDVFSRDDSIGGRHTLSNERLDMRLAFSEGWGNAWAAIALEDKTVTNTMEAGGAQGWSIDVSAGDAKNPGWFSEFSVGKVFFDLNANAAIGLKPLWATMRTRMTSSPALSSVHAFAFGLAQNNPGISEVLTTLLGNQKIALPTDAYGTGESNVGSPEIEDLKPLYLNYAGLGSTLSGICVGNAADPNRSGNKLGEHRYVRLVLPAGQRTILVAKDAATLAATNPDLKLYKSSGLIGYLAEPWEDIEGGKIDITTSQEYVLSITDAKLSAVGSPQNSRTCFNLIVK
jgi:hypothetical protein